MTSPAAQNPPSSNAPVTPVDPDDYLVASLAEAAARALEPPLVPVRRGLLWPVPPPQVDRPA